MSTVYTLQAQLARATVNRIANFEETQMSGMRLRFFHCLLLASRMAVAVGGGGALFTDVAPV
jgi:hypothetical protein